MRQRQASKQASKEGMEIPLPQAMLPEKKKMGN